MKLFSRYVLFLIILLLCQETVGQNSLRLYPYRMDTRKHPDYNRYHVKSPDPSVFDNAMQFISLRDLSTPDYKDWIDQWVFKDKLGNILWPAYPLIYQENLKEVVKEVKKKNLYLFDLWGYVPGSGPGGIWQQYIIPDGVLDLFESELGNRWLGMDNGEQDGRYVGRFAPYVKPMNESRQRQYFNFQRHFQKMGDELGNKLSTLVSLNFGHYFLKEGTYTLIGAETAQGLPNSQVYYSFIRGAGKQYGVSWFGNASVWNRWGYKTYGHDATNIEEDYGSGGPLKGTSLSLLKRLMYHHIFYNCVAAGFEGSMYYTDPKKGVRETKLSPIGKIQQEAVKWVEKNGDPGIMYTPIAVMTDFFSGWSFPRHLYTGDAYKVWGNLPYAKGDYLTDNVLDILYPGYQDASYYRNERGFVTPTPYGDMTDCLLSDAAQSVLNQYPVLVIGGELQPGIEINDKLEQYVLDGGHLIITAGSLKNLRNGIAGVKALDRLITTAAPVLYQQTSIEETSAYTLTELQYPATAYVIQRSGEHAAAVQQKAGKGKVTVVASPFAMPDAPADILPIKVKEETPLAKPFPMLNHVKMLLADIFQSVQLFEVGKDLNFITCVRNKDEYTILLSNDNWSQRDFNITSKIGKIVSITELKMDVAEMKEIGYTPKTVKEAVGKNSTKAVAGGNLRIFRVRISGADVEVQSEIPQKPNRTGSVLALHDIRDIKEEILSRPTFFAHYNSVLVDWRYLHKRDNTALQEEAKWISRQKLDISIDLSSGLNLYPDLRLVNNDSIRYGESMKVIKSVIDKMYLLGAKKLLLASHQDIENNITNDLQTSSMVATFQDISDYAAKAGIDIVLRASPGRVSGSVKNAVSLTKKVGRNNFRYAPSLALLLMNQQNLQQDLEMLTQQGVKDFLISTGVKDIHHQLWSVNMPLSSVTDTKEIQNILRQFPNANFIMDALYDSYDNEYLDIKLMEKLLK